MDRTGVVSSTNERHGKFLRAERKTTTNAIPVLYTLFVAFIRRRRRKIEEVVHFHTLVFHVSYTFIYSLFVPHPTTGSFSIHRSPTHTHTCHSLQRRSSCGVIDWTGWLFGWIALHYVHDTALTHDGDIITTTATRTRTTGFPQHFVAVHSFLHEYEPNDRYW